MDRLTTLEMFTAVAEQGSFSAAARKLRVSTTAVTRGVAELESRLGVVLFHRSTRAVALSNEGHALLPKARRILADVAATEREIQGNAGEPRGQLRVTAPVCFGRLHVLPVVVDLLDRYPLLDIEMLLLDRNVRIVEEGIDIAVRIGTLADSALKTLQIGSVRPIVVASPAYLERNGAPQTAGGLQGHRIIALNGPRLHNGWHIGGRSVSVPSRWRLMVNSVEAAIAAAEAGAGFASLLSYQAQQSIGDGKLVEVMVSGETEPWPVSLLFDAARSTAAAPRAFIEAMRARAKENCWT